MGLEHTDGTKPLGLEFSGVSNPKRKDIQQILNLLGADWDNCSYSSSLYSGKTLSHHIYFKKEIKFILRALRKTAFSYYCQLLLATGKPVLCDLKTVGLDRATAMCLQAIAIASPLTDSLLKIYPSHRE